jgi:hypothetical protein
MHPPQTSIYEYSIQNAQGSNSKPHQILSIYPAAIPWASNGTMDASDDDQKLIFAASCKTLASAALVT